MGSFFAPSFINGFHLHRCPLRRAPRSIALGSDVLLVWFPASSFTSYLLSFSHLSIADNRSAPLFQIQPHELQPTDIPTDRLCPLYLILPSNHHGTWAGG